MTVPGPDERAEPRCERIADLRPTMPDMESDLDLLERLRAGDEAAFLVMVRRYHGAMIRLARTYAPTDAIAEEAVQDTWMGVVRGIHRFEGRSSFKTWLFRILVNRAKTAGEREPRHEGLDEEPAVDPGRFDAGGAWAQPLERWEEGVDDRVVAATWSPVLKDALQKLPLRQREVVVLRDAEGLTSEEVCRVSDISEGNQRVLLHRGRSRLRALLEDELIERGR